MALQTDNYGRVVEISTSELISGLTSAVKSASGASGAAGKLASAGENSKTTTSQFNDLIKPLLPMFSDKMDIDEINKWLEKIHALIKEVDKKKESYNGKRNKQKNFSEAPNFRDMTSSFEKALKDASKDSIWDKKRGAALDHFLKEATTGHSIHVHDYTAVNVLTQIAKDIKHIGMIIKSELPNRLTVKQSKMVGSFEDPISEFLNSPAGRGKYRKSIRKLMSVISARSDYTGDLAPQIKVDISPLTEAIKEKKNSANEVIKSAVSSIDSAARVVQSAAKGVQTAASTIGSASGSPGQSKRSERSTDNLARTVEAQSRNSHRLESASEALFYALRGNSRSLGFLRHQMEDLAFGLAGLEKLSPDNFEKIALAIRRMSSMDKGDRKRLIDEVKKLQSIMVDKDKGPSSKEFEQQAARTVTASQTALNRTDARQNREYNRYMFREIRDSIRTAWHAVTENFSPHIYGIGREFDMVGRMRQIRDETGEWVRNIHLQLSQNMGLRGSLLGDPGNMGYRQGPASLQPFLEQGNILARDFNVTGQEVAKIQSVLLRNLSRGITLYSRWNALSRQGLQLGRMIGVDAEQTSEELADWHQHMGLTVTQTGQLVRELHQVSTITGVTGEKLLEAARAGRQLADNMRSAGTLTGEAARHLIQFSAAASRRGTDRVVAPIIEALTSAVNLFDRSSPQTFALAMQAAQRGGVMAQLQAGTVMQDRRAGIAFAQGLRQVLMQLTGGRNLNQLNPRERMVLNLAAQSTYGMQLNDIQMAAETIEEGFMTTAERIRSLQQQIERGGLSTRETEDIRNQIARMQQLQIGENMNEALRRLMQPGVNRATAGADINTALEGIAHAADHLRGPMAEQERTRLRTEAARLRGLVPGALGNDAQFQQLLQDMDELIRGQQIWETMYQLDQNTFQRENQERFQRQGFEDMVRRGLLHIMAWSPPTASLYNSYIGLINGTAQILERLGIIAMAIWGLRTLFQLFRIGGFGGGGFGGGGGPGGGGFFGGIRPGPAIATTWLAADLIQGGPGQAGTGFTNPTEGGWDTAAVPVRGAAIGAMYGGPWGAAIGALVGATVELTRQFIRLNEVVQRGIQISLAGQAATHNRGMRHLTESGQREIAEQMLQNTGAVQEAGGPLQYVESVRQRSRNEFQGFMTNLSRSWPVPARQREMVREYLEAHAGENVDSRTLFLRALDAAGITANSPYRDLRNAYEHQTDPNSWLPNAGRARPALDQYIASLRETRGSEEALNYMRESLIMQQLSPELQTGPLSEVIRARIGEYVRSNNEQGRVISSQFQRDYGINLASLYNNIRPTLEGRQQTEASIRQFMESLNGPGEATTAVRSALTSYATSRNTTLEDLIRTDPNAVAEQINRLRSVVPERLRPEVGNIHTQFTGTTLPLILRNQGQTGESAVERTIRQDYGINRTTLSTYGVTPESFLSQIRTAEDAIRTLRQDAGRPADQRMPQGERDSLIQSLQNNIAYRLLRITRGEFLTGDAFSDRTSLFDENAITEDLRRRLTGRIPEQQIPSVINSALQALRIRTVRFPNALQQQGVTQEQEIEQLINSLIGTPAGAAPTAGAAPAPAAGTMPTFGNAPHFGQPATTPGQAVGQLGLIQWLDNTISGFTRPANFGLNQPGMLQSGVAPGALGGAGVNVPGSISHLAALDSLSAAQRTSIAQALGITEAQLRSMSTSELYGRLSALNSPDAAATAFRSSIQSLIPESERVLHRDLINNLSPQTREYLAAAIGLPSAGQGDNAIRAALAQMPTGELLRRVRGVNPATLGSHAGAVATLRSGLENLTRPATSTPTPGPAGGAATPANTSNPEQTGAPNYRDSNFWWNVNRIEDMIWQYVPNMDMMRTHQIAIGAWDEYRRRAQAGNVNENTLRDIIFARLRAAGVNPPATPATETPFGNIAVGPDGAVITPTPGWTGAVQTNPTVAAIEAQTQSNQTQLTEIGQILMGQTTELQQIKGILQMGAEPGSFYVSDVHMQKRWDDDMGKFTTTIPLMETAIAKVATAAGLDDYEQSKQYKDINSIEVTGPLNDAVGHMDDIESNTKSTAEETKNVKELLQRLVSLMSGSEPPNTTSNSRPGSIPNYFSWGLDMTTSYMFGARNRSE